MADDIERLVLEMSADLKRFEKGLDRANRTGERRLSQIEKRFERAGQRVASSMAFSADNVNRAIAGIAVGVAIREVSQYADVWTRTGNQLAAAGVPMGEVADRQRELVDLAKATRTELEPTVNLYTRLTRATESLDVSSTAVARATEIVNKAFKAGGAAASEQAAGILQLGQAIGSGVLQGDELRSLRENAPLVAQAIADEFNTTIGGLKALGAEGKLTSDRVFAAILKGGAAIDAQFARTTPTIADSFAVLRTTAAQFFGELDRGIGATEAFSRFVNFAAENVDALAASCVIAATVIGGVLAGQAIAALIGAVTRAAVTAGITSAAFQAMGVRAAFAAAGVNVLRGALAFFGGPIGLAIAAVSIAIGLIAFEANRAVPPTEALTRATDDLSKATDAYEQATLAAQLASGDARKTALEEANALRAVAVEARNAANEKLVLARATLAAAAAAQADYARRIAFENAPGGNRGDRPGSLGPVGGPSRGEVRQAQADARAAADAIAAADARIARIDENLNRPLIGAPSAPGAGAGGGRGRSGPTVEELRTQAAIEQNRLAGNEAIAQALEDQLDLTKRTAAYEEAGLSAAAARAAAAEDLGRLQAIRSQKLEEERQAIADANALEAARLRENVDLVRELERDAAVRQRVNDLMAAGLNRAEATAQAVADQAEFEDARADAINRGVGERQRALDLEIARSDEAFEQVRALEKREELEASIRDYQDLGLSKAQAETQALADQVRLEEARVRARQRYIAEAEAERQLRLAELRGDTRTAGRLDRGIELRNRSRDYQDRGGMDPAEADARARREILEETRAAAQGAFRDAFRNGVLEAIRSGDVIEAAGEFALNAANLLTEKVLNQAGDALFEFLAEQFPNLFDLGQELLADTTAATTMSTAITTSAATGGAAIGASMTAAGATVAGGVGLAITGGAATAGTIMAAAIVAGGTQAAAQMAAAIAAAGGGGGGTGSAIAAAFMGGRAGGGPVRYHMRNERGPEPFVPTSQGVVFSTQAMRGLASLGKLASQGGGMGGDLHVEVVNATGVPATVKQERTPSGAKVTLEPMFEKALEGAGRSGALGRAARKSPQPTRRG